MRPLIKRMDYDAGKRQLTVSFQTSSYVYHDVPVERGNAITGIFSSAEQEHAFASGIEGKYRSERVTA